MDHVVCAKSSLSILFHRREANVLHFGQNLRPSTTQMQSEHVTHVTITDGG